MAHDLITLEESTNRRLEGYARGLSEVKTPKDAKRLADPCGWRSLIPPTTSGLITARGLTTTPWIVPSTFAGAWLGLKGWRRGRTAWAMKAGEAPRACQQCGKGDDGCTCTEETS